MLSFRCLRNKKVQYRILSIRNRHARHNIGIEKENSIGRRQLAEFPTIYDLYRKNVALCLNSYLTMAIVSHDKLRKSYDSFFYHESAFTLLLF